MSDKQSTTGDQRSGDYVVYFVRVKIVIIYLIDQYYIILYMPIVYYINNFNDKTI